MSDNFRILSPANQRVFQRDARNRASIPIAGTLSAHFDRIDARAVVEEGCTGQRSDWVALPVRNRGDDFRATLSLPAGGWYRLELRATRRGRVVAKAHVPRVGVGEVFVVAGQSNAANCGQSRLRVEDERVVAYDEGQWRPANDPQPGSMGGEGGSFVPPLGTMLAQSLQLPIGFVGSAVGGSALAWWFPHPARQGTPEFPRTPKMLFGSPVENLRAYENLLRRVAAQGKRGARSVLWHQGESDDIFKTPATLYRDGMRFLIRQLNKDLGYRLPWVVARASFHPGAGEKEQRAVAQGQRLIWREGVALEGPSTDDLLGPLYRHDKVHFSAHGLRVHAARWFAMLWAHFFADIPLAIPARR